MKRHIYTFNPILKSTVWGGEKIASYKHLDIDRTGIGECWELSAVPGSESTVTDGEDKDLTLSQLCDLYGPALLGSAYVAKHGLKFPLLVKIIDARTDLSVQVHPDDRLAMQRHNSLGKTEMWYVVDTDTDATIACGLSKRLTPAEFSDVIDNGDFTHCLARYKSAPGDCYFIPAGRVHSIGGGNLIIEIQQSSDITYRIYDFGRLGADGKPRQLHVDLAMDAIDYSVCDDYRTHYRTHAGQLTTLVDSPCFKTSLLKLSPEQAISLPCVDSFRIIVAVDNDIEISTGDGQHQLLHKGHTALIAAETAELKISPNRDSDATALYCTLQQ